MKITSPPLPQPIQLQLRVAPDNEAQKHLLVIPCATSKTSPLGTIALFQYLAPKNILNSKGKLQSAKCKF